VGWLILSLAHKFHVFDGLTGMGAVRLGFNMPDANAPCIVIWSIAKLFGFNARTWLRRDIPPSPA
jgi:hypothetical protein